ncbi:pur operon repressor [Mahella sp.]|uniref:pur operon repressor n=1 Tax=Mahella sp. TaxID=2798721 RepID=UPI0025B8E333|nr:pur operon repressor [Mahella sp.]MBZ4666080.1 purine operon repressor, PurR [Mahella sp.]MDK2990933.1 purine operon repressor [Clostridiales bacterium]
MQEFKRNERISIITKILIEHPNRVYGLDFFVDMFKTAKSTISEDIAIIKDAMAKSGMGDIYAVLGAGGGIRYAPDMPHENKLVFANGLAEMMSQPDRIIPGGYIYMNDIIYRPDLADTIGLILASYFVKEDLDYVVTVETKGIPLAMAVARQLAKPLLIVRRENRVTEGSAISINYVSGSSRRIQTMSLSRRSLSSGSRVVFIDDFMKAGGTAKGILDLMKEFGAEVVNNGVLVATSTPLDKLVDKYIALFTLYGIDEFTGKIDIHSNL